MFSSKHLQQAIHLADEALDEIQKVEDGDQAYIVDCYLSSLEYMIAALPQDCALSDFPGSVHRQNLLHSKLGTLISRTTNHTNSDKLSITRPDPHRTTSSIPWPSLWPIKSNRTHSHKELPINPTHVSEPLQLSEVTSFCQCGRRVSIKLPEWLLDQNSPRSNLPTDRKFNWADFIAAGIVSLVLSIKNSPLPHWFSLFIGGLLSWLIHLESVFSLRERIDHAIRAAIKRAAELDDELGLHQLVGTLISWMIETVLKVSVGLARAEGFRSDPVPHLQTSEHRPLTIRSEAHHEQPSGSDVSKPETYSAVTRDRTGHSVGSPSSSESLIHRGVRRTRSSAPTSCQSHYVSSYAGDETDEREARRDDFYIFGKDVDDLGSVDRNRIRGSLDSRLRGWASSAAGSVFGYHASPPPTYYHH